MERIGDSVFHLDELHGAPTLVVDPDTVTLVDAGLPDAAGEILSALASLGREPHEVGHILVTHADPDHVGGLAALAKATGAEVWAGSHEADVIVGETPNRRGDVRVWGRVDRRLEPGERIDLHGGIDVVATYGHTLGHLVYFLRREGVLLAGDCVGNRDGLHGSPPHLTADEERAREAVRIVASLRPRSVCFGHGPSLVGDAAERLEALARELS